jgi:hypothetical protein
MRFLILVVLVVLVLSAIIARDWWLRHHQPPLVADEPWHLEEHPDGDYMAVYAVKPGEERIWLGATAIAAEDFDQQMELIRSRARVKLVAMNSGRELRR